MKPTFEKTVDILVKAYLNDTLKHANCKACAVGNIIEASGYALTNENDTQWLQEINYACRNERPGENQYNQFYNESVAKKQVESTGYTIRELHCIEKAFESRWEVFDSLMAVVDVLAEIHGIDLTQREEAKLLFQKS